MSARPISAPVAKMTLISLTQNRLIQFTGKVAFLI